MRAVHSLAVLALVGALPSLAKAQECDCDHVVDVETRRVDGAELGIAPGDRVCLTAGEREFLRFSNLTGTAEAPIEILNCGGLVRIHNEDRAYALVFEDDSQFFHLTGTGDAALTYGIEISAPDREPYPGVGLWLLGRSTNYEADHIEIHDTGFAGVSAKTDPLCDGRADQGTFTQRDVSFHHMYVHDTVGEGFYIGSTQANGQTIRCEGVSETRQPHFLEGVRLTDNVIENTGWDGAQIGMAREGCVVARNVIRNVGLEGVEFQQQGLQIGSFSKCEIHRNRLENGPTNGIFVLEADDTWVHDNVVIGFEGDGIYANVRDRFEGKRYRFHHNTIVGSGEDALQVFGGTLGPSEAISNLVVGNGTGVSAGGDVDWTAMGNVELAMGEGGFTGAGDYHLAADSPARGAGAWVEGLDLDFEGYPRPDPPSAGAYEYRDPDVDAAFTPTDGGALPERDGGPGGGGGGGGCGCRASAGAPIGALWALVALVAIRRRARR